MRPRIAVLAVMLGTALPLVVSAQAPAAQSTAASSGQAAGAATEAAKRPTQRLYMHDGSFQVVTEYHMAGERVRFFSAERGKWEEVPTELVDIPRTQQWNREHASLPKAQAPRAAAASATAEMKPAEPEHPAVADGLELADGSFLFALDNYRDTNELIPLRQEAATPPPVAPKKTDKKQRQALAPIVQEQPRLGMQAAPIAAHAAKANGKNDIRLRTTESRTRLHIQDPVFFVHGAAQPVSWVLVRVIPDVNRRDRYLAPVTADVLQGRGRDALGFQMTALPGGKWTRLKPVGPIPIGEYALVQVLSPGTFDEHVWDFAIDPTAGEDPDAIPAAGGRSR